MKKFCSIALLIIISCHINISQSFSQRLKEIKRFGKNPGNLDMFYYKPEKHNDSIPAPLVVVLHGCIQNAKRVAIATGWNKLADLHGFIVLYPEQSFVNNVSQCFNWFRNKDISKGRGESISIKHMTDYMLNNFNIDTSQVFITGLSAGAAMSVAVMAGYPKTFNAGAIFAGGAYRSSASMFTALHSIAGWINRSPEEWGDLVRNENPGYPGPFPRLIVYQGTADHVVNKRNGNELIEQWTNVHNTDTIPDSTKIIETDSVKISRYTFLKNDGSTAVIYYKILDRGHTLLIDPGEAPEQGGTIGKFAADCNFHSTYQTASDFGILKED